MTEPTIALHNVPEVYEVDQDRFVAIQPNEPLAIKTPIRTQRVPEAVRVQLNEHGQFRMHDASAIEIRFVSDGPVTLTLSTCEPWAAGAMSQYQGDLKFGQPQVALGPEPSQITLKRSDRLQRVIDRLKEGGDSERYARRLDWTFNPEVTRLRMPWEGGPITIHKVEVVPGVTCRAPKPDELPKRRMLSYGTSITHGACASQPELTYAAQTAYHLQADLINLGSGGSAHCEYELADYIAAREDWDFATLALSVNMQHFEQTEYRSRLSYMVKTIAAAHPRKPVFAITLWPYFRDLGIVPGAGNTPEGMPEAPEVEKLASRMRRDLRDAVEAAGQDNLHLLEGPALFGTMRGLMTDLIHPDDMGMISMANNLAAAIKPHLEA